VQARLIDNSDPMPVVVCGDFNSTPGSLLLSDFVIKGQMSFIHVCCIVMNVFYSFIHSRAGAYGSVFSFFNR
jgi:endonuclease/exonuclease/phosphatase (EEP) superfamily protein YafD